MKQIKIFLAALVCAGSAVQAQVPGEYLDKGGWGQLQIKPGQAGKMPFAINSMGANGHSCTLDGVIVKQQASLPTMKDEPACEVKFAVSGTQIEVTSNEACRYFCGMRAGFDGKYQLAKPGCTVAERRSTRKQFKALYDKKDYAAALAKLTPVLQTCAGVMPIFENAWVRNDVALAHYKLGQKQQCRETLQELAADANLTEEQVKEKFPPSDAETYWPIVKATRTNLRLCAG